MLPRLLCVALAGVKLRAADLCGQGLKVSIDLAGGRELLVPILEEELAFTLFWHLNPYYRLPNALPRPTGSLVSTSRRSACALCSFSGQRPGG